MVTARSLSKKFADSFAIHEISFHIEPGEFVFLTGRSGSGKTTLLRLILRDIRADTGELVVDGQNVAKIKSRQLPAYRRLLGPVFQDFRLLPDMKVAENVSLPLQFRGVKSANIESAVKLALEMVDLPRHAQLFPAQLSGGEIQRVALARAIVGKPKVILADEPTGNLDPKTAKSIVKLLMDIHSEMKTTVIMATHNADIVNHSSQRVITLEAGKLVSDDPKGKYEHSH